MEKLKDYMDKISNNLMVSKWLREMNREHNIPEEIPEWACTMIEDFLLEASILADKYGITMDRLRLRIYDEDDNPNYFAFDLTREEEDK